MQAWSESARSRGLRLGIVPTMGKLHEGHLSLVRVAASSCDRVLVSIFVNPTQFGPGEDYEKYPRCLEADLNALAGEGVSVCFAPSVAEMYPHGQADNLTVEWGKKALCGAGRPGHFDGVTSVVSRLYNAMQPHVAVYGQKDAQQALIIRRMTESMLFPVKTVLGAIVRERDGLAMSSRNIYLDPAERERALTLSRALTRVGESLRAGERDPGRLQSIGNGALSGIDGVEPEYFVVVDPATLAPHENKVDGLLLIACAAKLGKTRLIDNHVYRIQGDDVRESMLF
ncbi:MAG: pantoate--beta-alanine ligase [bacterium]|nr:pantoate--beta-alanine ligase [bacterium]